MKTEYKIKCDECKKTIKEYRVVVKELLDSMHEEYVKGATAMWNQIRKEVSGCYLNNDGCSICICGRKFLNKLEKQNENIKR